MAVYNEVKPVRTLMGKLKHDADLLDELTAICQENDIRLGRVEAIGAVKKARLGFYDQQKHEYHFTDMNQNMELSNLIGNISMRDGKSMVHAHITVCDSDDKCYGGHLTNGTIVFACEFVITVYEGPDYCREHDEETGLPLWKM